MLSVEVKNQSARGSKTNWRIFPMYNLNVPLSVKIWVAVYIFLVVIFIVSVFVFETPIRESQRRTESLDILK